MLIAIWNMITHGTCYREPGADFYTRLNPNKTKNRALDQLRKMATPSPLPPGGQGVTVNLRVSGTLTQRRP
jgi:transposase